jgi:hypothetical protein
MGIPERPSERTQMERIKSELEAERQLKKEKEEAKARMREGAKAARAKAAEAAAAAAARLESVAPSDKKGGAKAAAAAAAAAAKAAEAAEAAAAAAAAAAADDDGEDIADTQAAEDEEFHASESENKASFCCGARGCVARRSNLGTATASIGCACAVDPPNPIKSHQTHRLDGAASRTGAQGV